MPTGWWIELFVLIVGGGKVGYYLAKTLAPEKHRITLIEEDADLCKKIATELSMIGVNTVHGDGTDTNFLMDAEIEYADILIAVTGNDQNNLVACQLAKNYFHVPRTIARVNNPKNIHVLKRLGVDSVVSSTAHIADIIEHEVDWTGIDRMLASRTGNLRIRDFVVEPDSSAAGKQVANLNLPEGVILISLIRGNSAMIPNGQTQLLAGDSVITASKLENLEKLADCFGGSKRRQSL